MEFLMQNMLEFITLVVTIYIARQNIKANKEITILKSNIETSQKKKSIEYEEIQTYKVQRISDFMNKFSNYIVNGAIEKIEGKNVKKKNSNSDLDLRKEFKNLINTLILFCDDETFIEYKKFQTTLLNLVDEYEELKKYLSNIPLELKDAINKGKIHLPKEIAEKSNRLVIIDKEIKYQYGQLVVSLRKSIGIETKLNPEEYVKVYLQMKD